MKKIFVLILALMMAFILCACGNDRGGLQVSDANLPPLEFEEISEWPENKYTAAIVQPEVGTPYMATVYNETAGYFSVSLNNATREQSEEYIKLLKENGFVTVFEKSESAAAGDILQKENVVVSIAASENEFGIYIRLYEDANGDNTDGTEIISGEAFPSVGRAGGEIGFEATINRVEDGRAYATVTEDGAGFGSKKLPENIVFNIDELDVELKAGDTIYGNYLKGTIDGQTVRVVSVVVTSD